LTEALADASDLRDDIVPKIRERKARINEYQEQLKALSVTGITDWDMRRFRRELEKRTGDLAGILHSNTEKAREVLTLLLDGPLVVWPEMDGDRKTH
jgi:hypothetical protein